MPLELSNVIKQRVNLTLQRRQDFEFVMSITDSNNLPLDLTNYSFYLELRFENSPQLSKNNADFTALAINQRKVILTAANILSLDITKHYTWFLEATRPDTLKEIWYFGNLLVIAENA